MSSLHMMPFGPPADPTATPVRLYGGPTLFEDEEEVALTPQQEALLSVVAVHGGSGVSRSRVAWLMWEEDAEEPARRRISQLLYGLKKRTSIAPVVADGDDLKPSPELPSDLDYLRLRKALRPVTGKPLGKLAPSVATGAFEKWLTTQRTTLRYLAIERNGELLASSEENHDYELVTDAARALLEFDPVNERALRSLVRSLALSQSALQAEAAYRHQVEIVARILPDWTPSQETRRLLGEIDSLRHRQAGPPTSRDLQHAVRLVGRRRELTTLREYALGPGPPYRDIMIVGDPGVGKSRLLEELGRQLSLDDCRLIRVRSYAAEEGIAFNFLSDIARSEPFQEAIRNVAPLWRQVLSMSLTIEPVDVPEEDLPEVPAESASRRAYEALRHLFDSVEGRVVILADGFGAADSSSLAALAFLRRRISKSTIRLIGTVGRDALSRTDSQAQYLQNLFEDVDAKLELEALSAEDSTKLLAAAREEPLAARDEEELVRLAGGNPLFLIELAQGEEGGKSEHYPGGAPAALHELLSRRFSSTSPSTRTFLNVLSAQTAPSSLGHIARICEFLRGEALTSLDEATQRRLITSTPDGLSFRHGIMQRWIYDLLSEAQRRFIHAATAEQLLESGNASPGELAFHYHHAGDQPAAFRWAQEGADDAMAHAAFPNMVRLLAIAVDSAPTTATKFEMLSLLGETLICQSEMRKAVHTLQEAESITDETFPWHKCGLVQIRRWKAAAEVEMAAPHEALKELEKVKTEARKRGETQVALAAIDAQLVIANSSMFLDTAREYLMEAQEITPADDDLPERCALRLIETFNLLYGEQEKAVLAVNEALRLAEAGDLQQLWLRSAARYLIVHCWVGDLEAPEVSLVWQKVKERARVTGNLHYLLRIYVNLSTWLIDIQNLDRAETLLIEADNLVASQDADQLRVSLEANWGELHLRRKNFEMAELRFQSSLRHAPTLRTDVRLSATAGWGLCCLELGRLSEARKAIDGIHVGDFLSGTINFDPSLIIELHARWLDRNGMSDASIELLDRARRSLQKRYVPAGYKLGIVQVQIMKRRGIPGSERIAAHYEKTARKAHLHGLSKTFNSLR